jgi:hypothetical protein
MHNDEVPLRDLRVRSQKFIQSVFGFFALVFLALGLVVHHAPDALGFSGELLPDIAQSFLFMGVGYTVTLLLWEWLHRGDI